MSCPRIYEDYDLTPLHRLVLGAQEPTIPLHLQRVWDLDSKRVGLTWIATAIPTFFCSLTNVDITCWFLIVDSLATALVGIWVDRSGTEWPTIICILLCLPWWFLLFLEYRLALFISAFAFEGKKYCVALVPIAMTFSFFYVGLAGPYDGGYNSHFQRNSRCWM